jgi:hypothetical protein
VTTVNFCLTIEVVDDDIGLSEEVKFEPIKLNAYTIDLENPGVEKSVRFVARQAGRYYYNLVPYDEEELVKLILEKARELSAPKP